MKRSFPIEGKASYATPDKHRPLTDGLTDGFQNGRWGEAERAAELLWGPQSLKTAMADLKAGGMREGEREVGWGDLVSRRYIKGEMRERMIVVLGSFL